MPPSPPTAVSYRPAPLAPLAPLTPALVPSSLASPAAHGVPLPLPRYHRLHKLVKRTLTRLVSLEHGPGKSAMGAAGAAAALDDIFERLCTLPVVINPETPAHYLTENYIPPILDTTAELITDPKVDYNLIQLNCCGDDGDAGAALGDELAADDGTELFTPRSRLRSIISTSLMSCLDPLHQPPKLKRVLRLSLRRDDGAWALPPALSPALPFHKPQALPTISAVDRDDPLSHLIDFYSFADMCRTEGKERKGLVFTILAQDHTNELLREKK